MSASAPMMQRADGLRHAAGGRRATMADADGDERGEEEQRPHRLRSRCRWVSDWANANNMAPPKMPHGRQLPKIDAAKPMKPRPGTSDPLCRRWTAPGWR